VNILVFFIGIFSHLAYAHAQPEKDPLNALEQEIEIREKQLDGAILKGENQMADSQAFMIEDWSEFEQKVKEMKNTQEEVIKLKKEIQKLEDKKAELLNQSNSLQNPKAN